MKNTTNKLVGSFVLALLVLIHSGCKKWVNVDTPNNQLVTSSVFNNSATATSAQLGIYAQMVSNSNAESYNISLQTGLLGDELTSSSSLSYRNYYLNAMIPGSGVYYGPWQNAYRYIYQANAIIEGLQKTEGITPSIKQQLSGESKFVRAFWHFYLVNCYGDVPIVTTTNYKINATIPRSPKAQVYQQIISDLRDAQNFLNAGYVDVSDITTYEIASAERVRPNKSAATALLARAYLYEGDYVNAAIQASAVITNSAMYNLENDLNKVFLKNSREAIWQLAIPLTTSINTFDGNQYILQSAPNNGNVTISPQLLSSFEPLDQRKINWIGSIVTVPAGRSYFPYKYKVKTGSAVSEYQMVLRLSEQFLIRAEARLLQGSPDIVGALSDLNVIRNRAGLANYSGATDINSLKAAILHERQVELFTEWGNRWFDLQRTGNINATMSIVAPLKGGTWNPNGYQALFSIPLDQLIFDKNLTQNPGY